MREQGSEIFDGTIFIIRLGKDNNSDGFPLVPFETNPERKN